MIHPHSYIENICSDFEAADPVGMRFDTLLIIVHECERNKIYLSANLIKTAHSFSGCITIFIVIRAEQLFTEKINFEDLQKKLYKDHLVGRAKRAAASSCRRFFNRLAAQAKAPP